MAVRRLSPYFTRSGAGKLRPGRLLCFAGCSMMLCGVSEVEGWELFLHCFEFSLLLCLFSASLAPKHVVNYVPYLNLESPTDISPPLFFFR